MAQIGITRPNDPLNYKQVADSDPAAKKQYQMRADAAGISLDDYYQVLASTAGNTGGPNQQGLTQTQTLGLLGLLNKSGMVGGAQQTQQAPQGSVIQKAGADDPANYLNLLGAQAERRVGLNPSNTMIVNPRPGSGMGKDSGQFEKTGVSPVSAPTVYDISGQPMPQTAVPSIFSPAGVPEAQQYFAQQAGAKMGAVKPEEIPADTALMYWKAMHPGAGAGPTSVPTQTAPVQPAAQPGAAQMSQGTPFASTPTVQPMAAPTVPIAGIQLAGTPPQMGGTPGGAPRSPFLTGGPPTKEQMPVRAMQAGGLVTEPTLALIGENGPEMVTPLNKRRNPERPPVLGAPEAPGAAVRPPQMSPQASTAQAQDAPPVSNFHDLHDSIRPSHMYTPDGRIPYQPSASVNDWMTGQSLGPPSGSLGKMASPTVGDWMAGSAAGPASGSLGKMAPAAPGGMSMSQKLGAAQGLIDMASKVGKPLQDYGANASWQPIANAIPAAPGPNDYTNRYPLVSPDDENRPL